MREWAKSAGLLMAVAGCFLFVLLINGAIPFFMCPTLGQAIWSTGFAQSLANGSLFSVHAYNFGVPQPAAIAFGLSGVWPASALIRLGLQPADAYAAMMAMWLGLAFLSSYRLARKFGATSLIAALGSVAWLSMPIVWAHMGYSTLSLGIALLPFYFLTALTLLQVTFPAGRRAALAVICHVVAAVIAVFMDGYTFVMFAAGTGILLAHAIYSRPGIRSVLLRVAAPVYAASFALAYVLYSVYVGRGGYGGDSIDFFRGWGVDLSYLVIPTRGMLWLSDKLSLGIERTEEFHFGDDSVWETTFCLPILLLALVAWRRATRGKIAVGLALVAAFGFYMSLGPSLKIDSLKPESLRLSHPRQQSVLMPPDAAVMPTGNAWISEKLPGFKEMRAAYRWAALGIFAAWLLVMIGGPYQSRRGRGIWCVALVAIVAINVPNRQKLREYTSYRQMFRQVDRDLVGAMGHHVRAGETVAFLPWGNDFMAGYLAATLRFHTFNIGGDKNVAMAQSRWPWRMGVQGQTLGVNDAFQATGMLADGTADVIVLPYFNKLWSAHIWPCLDEISVPLSDGTREKVRGIPHFLCPDQRRVALRAEIDAFRQISYVMVEDTGLFATVRLRPEYVGREHRDALLNAMMQGIEYPIDLRDDIGKGANLLYKGWHRPEANFVWSTGNAILQLPKPDDCMTGTCNAVLHFMVFGASPIRPVEVTFADVGPNRPCLTRVTATSGDSITVRVPLDGPNKWRRVSISVPNAISPNALLGTSDTRELGVALQRVELVHSK